MANINEVKLLLGGMDKENSPETMNMYDYLDAHIHHTQDIFQQKLHQDLFQI